MASKYLSFIHSHKCLPIRTKQFAVSRQWTGCMVVYENHLWKCAKMLWISLQESDSLSSFIGQEPKASNTFISNWLWWQSVPKTDLLVKSQDFHLIRDTCGVAGGGCGGGGSLQKYHPNILQEAIQTVTEKRTWWKLIFLKKSTEKSSRSSAKVFTFLIIWIPRKMFQSLKGLCNDNDNNNNNKQDKR